MRAVDKLCGALTELDLSFFHAAAPVTQGYPYALYTNYTDSFFKADDRIDDVTAYIQIDYYTQEAFDGGKEAIAAALDDKGWPFGSNYFYEAEKKLHHYVFDVQIEDDV